MSFSIFVCGCDQIDHLVPLTVKIAVFHPRCQQQPVTREQTVSFPQQYDFNFGIWTTAGQDVHPTEEQTMDKFVFLLNVLQSGGYNSRLFVVLRCF